MSLITVTALGRALENQAAKIAELEAENDQLVELGELANVTCGKYKARIAELEAAVRALRLEDPFFASEAGGDIYCFYCSQWQPDQWDDPQHEDNCPWLTSGKLVGE